jgi:hypothetical protein
MRRNASDVKCHAKIIKPKKNKKKAIAKLMICGIGELIGGIGECIIAESSNDESESAI